MHRRKNLPLKAYCAKGGSRHSGTLRARGIYCCDPGSARLLETVFGPLARRNRQEIVGILVLASPTKWENNSIPPKPCISLANVLFPVIFSLFLGRRPEPIFSFLFRKPLSSSRAHQGGNLVASSWELWRVDIPSELNKNAPTCYRAPTWPDLEFHKNCRKNTPEIRNPDKIPPKHRKK